jgi:SPP1 gp7 family putative phage head morphogenesis protein
VGEIDNGFERFAGSVAGPLAQGLRDNLQAILEEPSLPDEWTSALEEAGTSFLLWAHLKGREHALTQAPGEELPDEANLEDFADFEVETDEQRPFEEAINALRARLPVTPEDFQQFEAALRFRAFTAARLAEEDAITRLQSVLTEALEQGESLTGFIERVGADDILERSMFGPQEPKYFETVYRTNATTAYNAGRRQQIQDTSGVEHLVYVTIIDQRTTSICRGYDGIRRPADDPIWDQITPPNHFSCRSTVRAIYRGMAEADTDLTSEQDVGEAIRDDPPQDGFDAAPSTAGELAELPSDVKERAREYGILSELEERQTELGF